MCIPSFEERQKRSVVFTYPNGNKVKFYLLDESEPVESKEKNGDYCFTIQRLKCQNGEYILRFAYYRKESNEPPEKYRFGSQTTLTTAEDTVVKIFAKALKKQWFKDVVEKATDE